MKKFTHLIVAALIALVTSVSANADFRAGIKLGTNVNEIHFSKDVFDANNRAGFTGGVMAEFTVPLIGIGADISALYSYMDTKFHDDVTNINHTLGRNYLEIPLNLKYKLTLPAVSMLVKPYVFTGPVATFRLGKSLYKDIKTKNCQWGWNLGLGVEAFRHVQVGAGYTFGINNIVKKYTGIGTNEGFKIRNSYWTITAAYLF